MTPARRFVSNPPPGAVSDAEGYAILLNFSNFKDARRRNFCLDLPTSFFRSAGDMDRPCATGRVLPQVNIVFQDLLRELVRARAAAVDEGG